MEPSPRCVSAAPPARDRPGVVLAGPRGGPPADSQPLARGAEGRGASAAFIWTCFRVPRCVLVAKLNRDRLFPGTVPS